jgi:hypothetical protein
VNKGAVDHVKINTLKTILIVDITEKECTATCEEASVS